MVFVQSRGYLPKAKSLEDVLRSCEKMEAKLIGFDETPIEVISPDLMEPETSDNKHPSKGNQSLTDLVLKGKGPCTRKPLVKQQINELVLNKPVAHAQATGNFIEFVLSFLRVKTRWIYLLNVCSV